MRAITVDINTIRDSLLSPAPNAMIGAYRTFISDGFVIRVVRNYNNADDDLLFILTTLNAFNDWVNQGCPANYVVN
jgi:hypothetical protein